MSKDFSPLHFAIAQVLSISGYDMENERMPGRQKYCIKNIAVKIPILFCSALVYFADLKTIYSVSCLCCSNKLL